METHLQKEGDALYGLQNAVERRRSTSFDSMRKQHSNNAFVSSWDSDVKRVAQSKVVSAEGYS